MSAGLAAEPYRFVFYDELDLWRAPVLSEQEALRQIQLEGQRFAALMERARRADRRRARRARRREMRRRGLRP